MFNWEFVNDLFGKDSAGTTIECPDYNEDKGYILFCEKFQPAKMVYILTYISVDGVSEKLIIPQAFS